MVSLLGSTAWPQTETSMLKEDEESEVNQFTESLLNTLFSTFPKAAENE